jgi:hypothetical protein
MNEKLTPIASIGASLVRRGELEEPMHAIGRFIAECYDKDGNLKWQDEFPNTVVVVGKNHMLNTEFAGSSYSVTGPFMGLISSSSFSAISTADTMASHAGWLEAGNANPPTYTSPRKTAVYSSASAGAIALSAALSFGITGTGTVKGGFITLGSGAVSTIDNTSGTLFSAGLFTGGDRAVVNLDTLNISWSCSL